MFSKISDYFYKFRKENEIYSFASYILGLSLLFFGLIFGLTVCFRAFFNAFDLFSGKYVDLRQFDTITSRSIIETTSKTTSDYFSDQMFTFLLGILMVIFFVFVAKKAINYSKEKPEFVLDFESTVYLKKVWKDYKDFKNTDVEFYVIQKDLEEYFKYLFFERKKSLEDQKKKIND